MTLRISPSVVVTATRHPVDALGTTLWIPPSGVDQPRNVRGCDLGCPTGPPLRSTLSGPPHRNAVTCTSFPANDTETARGRKVVHRLARFAGPRLTQPLKNQPQSGPVRVVPYYVGRALVDRPDYVVAAGAGPAATDRHHGEHTS